MAKMSTCPRDGTEVELRVLVRIGPPHGSEYVWVTARWLDAPEYRWEYGSPPLLEQHPGSRIDRDPMEWRAKGQTARIAAKQKSVRDEWVVTNGDPEFFEPSQSYWVMPRGEPGIGGKPQTTSPMRVTAMEIFQPDDPNGWLSTSYWNETLGHVSYSKITPKEVWAVMRAKPIPRPNVQEPARYEEVA